MGFFLGFIRCLINNSIKNILIFRNFEDDQILESLSSIITKIKFKKFQQFHTQSDGSSIFFTNTCHRVDPISMVLHIALSTLSLFFFHFLVFSLLRSFTFSFFRFLASQQKQTWKIKKKSSYNVDLFISLCCTVHILKTASNNSTVETFNLNELSNDVNLKSPDATLHYSMIIIIIIIVKVYSAHKNHII